MILFAAFLSLMIIVILHELGHFVLAKKFGMRVDEFGIGFPPRLWGKKIGETLYSVNLLPFGAFVRIFGEEGEMGQGSFLSKPIWQRVLVVLGGVIVFWIVGAVLLTIVMGLGVNVAIGDEEAAQNPKVQITAVDPASPAEVAGLKIGDVIVALGVIDTASGNHKTYPVTKVRELQDLASQYKGKPLFLTIQEGSDRKEVMITPRVSPPSGQGPLGISLIRSAIKSYPWYQTPLEGIKATWGLTQVVFIGWGQALASIFKKEPSGVQLMGPVGIFSTFVQVGRLGVAYFLQFVALLSVYLACFNILPIPVVDGGRILFLVIEKIRKKPINPALEQRINMFFFSALVFMMIWVTVKDIIRLF